MAASRKTAVALNADVAPFAIRSERASDLVAREALLDACFGANRQAAVGGKVGELTPRAA
jgi:hypothetical protein